MSPVSMPELRAFVAVARVVNFTQAAARLGVTQPALSMTVRHLEAKLGTTLFDRSTRIVRLTKVGTALLPAAERLVENFDRTVAGMKEVSEGRQGRIAIACPEGVAAHVIAPTLARFLEQNPEVAVSVHDGDASTVEHLMHSLGADFGVTGYWKAHADFVFEPLTLDRCCVICPAGHAFAARTSIRLADLHDVPLVALNRDTGVRRLIESACEAAGVRLAVQFEVARVSTLIEMVASGLCISVLTELSTPRNSGKTLAVVPLEGPGLAYDVGIVTRANRGLTPSAGRLVAALRERFKAVEPRPSGARRIA